MPKRNVVRNFVEGGIYHIYNRGVEKRDVFIDSKDYSVFLARIKDILSDLRKNDISDVSLIAYCLMPNHFHLLARQNSKDGITMFMKSLNTRYAMYFNMRHDRVGSLFEGSYKAVPIETDEQLMHVSRYIHLNPNGIRRSHRSFPYSSYKYFVGDREAKWIKPNPVLELFASRDEYAEFTSGLAKDSRELLGQVAID